MKLAAFSGSRTPPSDGPSNVIFPSPAAMFSAARVSPSTVRTMHRVLSAMRSLASARWTTPTSASGTAWAPFAV